MNLKYLFIVICISVTFLSCNDGGQNDEKATNYNNEGIIAFNNGNLDEAIVSYKKAVLLDKVSNLVKIGAVRNLAQAYIQKSEIDSATKYLNLAIALSKPNSYNYNINSADKLLLNDSTYEALLHLEKAEKQNKDDMSVNNMLGLIYLGEYGVAFKNARKALEYNRKAYSSNKDRNAGYVLALNYYALKRYTEAETILYDLNNRYPNNAEQQFLLGKCKYYLYNKSSGNIAFEKAISLDSDYKESVEYFKESYASEQGKDTEEEKIEYLDEPVEVKEY